MVTLDKAKVMTSAEVAKKYGVEMRDVLYATKNGKLPGAYKLGWTWVYPVDKLPEVWPVNKRIR